MFKSAKVICRTSSLFYVEITDSELGKKGFCFDAHPEGLADLVAIAHAVWESKGNAGEPPMPEIDPEAVQDAIDHIKKHGCIHMASVFVDPTPPAEPVDPLCPSCYTIMVLSPEGEGNCYVCPNCGEKSNNTGN